MDKKFFSLLVLVFCFSCNSKPREESLKNSPDLFGWTVQNISTLKNECMERYGKDQPDKNEMQKQNYCSCFVEKIIFSVKYENHTSPNEETIKLYGEFSKACEELTKQE